MPISAIGDKEAGAGTALSVTNLTTGYIAAAPAINDVDIRVEAGGLVAVLGVNGAGKSTLLYAIFGLLPTWRGCIHLGKVELSKAAPHRRFREGLALVSQDKDLFPYFSVEENLVSGSRSDASRSEREELLERVFSSFPRLRERRSQKALLLSGGEQRMLAIGRALMSRPKFLLMDEPSGGLAPQFVNEIGEIIRQLHQTGLSVLLVEQDFRLALSVAKKVFVMREGTMLSKDPINSADLTVDELTRLVFDNA
jgi:branched-chain amino acid transport system ATP-binding protein